MAEITAAARRDRAAAVDTADGRLRVAVGAAAGERLAAYARLAGAAWTAPAQSPEWVEAWAANPAADCLIATIESADRPIFALAAEVVRNGPVRVLRPMGGKHANGNVPVFDAGSASELTPACLARLWAGIRMARPDIDLVRLERLAPDIGGMPNPLLRLPHRRSPNLALAVDLAGGFDAVLERASGKRKRKKHRSQTRKFEAAGGARRIEARTPAEVRRFLDAFFEMKEQRFRTMGVADVFADPAIRTFFRQVFTASLGPSPRFVLHGLEVAGRLRAVTGSSICGDRIICEFGAIAEDELAHASPGDFLFFENIREAAEKGFRIYDFSVGDEPYKRLWSDIETTQFDVMLPLTVKGRAYASVLGLGAGAKRVIKNNPVLWGAVKRLRRHRAAPSRPGAED